MAPGTRIMSPKAAKILLGSWAIAQAVVDAAHGKHAHGATGAVDQFDVFGQDVFEAEAIDGMRVAAADLHDAIVAGGVG